MKLLIDSTSKVIKYANHFNYILESGKVIVKSDATTEEFHIGDMNSSNAEMVETGIALPSDFTGNKYKWVSNNFVANPDWVEPEEE